MKLEGMPVVTVEEVLRFRAEAIRQRDELERDYQRLLQGNAMTMEQAMSNGADAIAMRQERDELAAVVERQRGAMQAAIECGIVPISSAKDGAARHSRQVHVADQIREALALTPATALRLHEAGVLERVAEEFGESLNIHDQYAAQGLRRRAARLRAGGEG